MITVLWASPLVVVALGAAAPSTTGAEPPGGRTVTVAPDPGLGGSGWRRLFLGEGYRRLWTTPVAVPVLDLDTFAGGLRPVRRVGRKQTSGLALAGEDGHAYTFRSLRKEPERILPVEWRESFPASIVRDHTSALHPGAALLLPPLAEALGVLHTRPALVALPVDDALGEFREDLGGHLGTIEVYPRAAADGSGFAGAVEILTSAELWERWRKGGETVDARAFLRARILDLLVENYDRHAGQWRWARVPALPGWQPLPEDPDMAFIRNEGLAFDWLRGRAPKFVKFGPSFPRRLEGSTFSGSELDRWLLAGLDRRAFEEAAREAEARLTDAAIDAAVAALPPEWRSLDGERTAAALRARRERLLEHVLHYYRDLARQVDVHVTERHGAIRVVRADGGALEVEVLPSDGARPALRRVFLPGETSEVRLYLHGGGVRVDRSGPPGGAVRVRVVGGDAAGAGEDPAAPWKGTRDFGRWTMPYTQVLFASELDLLLGAGLTRTAWGFRSTPQASRQDASILWSTGESSGRLSYSGLFRRPDSPVAFRLDALASGIERTNFFGLGNETVKPEGRSAYRTLERFAAVGPSLRLEPAPGAGFHLGVNLRVSDTPTDRDNVLNASDAYGRGRFAEVGLRAGLHYDTRGFGARSSEGGLFETVATERGRRSDLRLELDGFFHPSLLDARESFGGLEGEVAGYIGRSRSRVQLAARAGGRRVWGEHPWFDSAFLGGRGSLRGYSRQRFAGDASLYGGVETRAWLFAVDVPPVPMRVGVLAFADAGRVWLAGETSRRWHRSWGGGLMLQPLATPFVVTAAVARSPEETRFYFGYGFFF